MAHYDSSIITSPGGLFAISNRWWHESGEHLGFIAEDSTISFTGFDRDIPIDLPLGL